MIDVPVDNSRQSEWGMMKRITWCVLALGLAACSDATYEQPIANGQPQPAATPAEREGIGSLRAMGKADQVCPEFPSYYYRFLDDTQCTKALPSNRDRGLTRPNSTDSVTVQHPVTGEDVDYVTADAPIIVDTTTLAAKVPESVKMTLILVKRVNGVPHYRYLSNGSHDDIIQPWSSTKFMAMANGAATLRKETAGTVGLDSVIGSIPLGDLGTVIHNYDERDYKSNALAAWFHDLGKRNQANHLIHEGWLNRSEAESFGGNYGMGAPDLGTDIIGSKGSLSLTYDPSERVANQLSTFTMAEFFKRLIMHREDEATRMPGIEWEDIEVILYGAPNSIWFEDSDPQGMESDTAVYVQQAFNAKHMEQRSKGQWRVFSKLGFGITRDRGAEFVHNSYACLPKVDDNGEPANAVGKEFILSFFGGLPSQ